MDRIGGHAASERSRLPAASRGGHNIGYWRCSREPDIWPDGSRNEAEEPPPLPSSPPLVRLDICPVPSASFAAPPPPRLPLPIHELPPRRKVVWIWICCCCGHGGMKVSVDPCPHCGIPRCPNCNTQRFHIRGSNGLPAPEDEDDFQDWFWRLVFKSPQDLATSNVSTDPEYAPNRETSGGTEPSCAWPNHLDRQAPA
ncbi:hypothetical protein B0J13DRAFT_230234 [Dactylonectria estremocensis]|uniref:Uncharacterized protein n=1 Tax=Dactylonectria estremocensis TaxID=1079267 RepID=A0A9P9F890_9HYPO|nr:hypothetical protein B0J13DRAFT_230234 [Dactylonectria estremocensis]